MRETPAAGWAISGRTGAATTASDVTHLDIGFPRDVEPYHLARGPAISPDGRTVAMVGVKDGVRSLFVRRLNRAEATEILVSASGSVSTSVFSPDSRSVAFIVAGGLVTRVGLADQQHKVLASGADVNGALAWSPAGVVFAQGGALWIVTGNPSQSNSASRQSRKPSLRLPPTASVETVARPTRPVPSES